MENETQNLCRICFDVGSFQLNAYEINIQGKNISINEMMKRFTDIEFTGGNAPELICENCTHDLVQSYLFTEKILEADARILSFTHPQQQKIITEEEYMQSFKEEPEFESHSTENEETNAEIMEGLGSEDGFVIEEETEIFEERSESNIVDDMYIESEVSADELEGTFVTEQEIETSIQINVSERETTENVDYNVFESEEEEINEPRRKYQRKNRTDNEVDKNGSFVITQFASSTNVPGIHKNINSDDTDEVALSDVRIMNYETVEIKAGNINCFNEAPKSELPIDDSRVYLCQYCPRAFSSSSFLVAHVRKTHGCKFCASLFEKATDLYAHIREAHTKFECVVCGKEFASNSNMRNHLKIVHKVKVPANVSLIAYKKQSDSEETES